MSISRNINQRVNEDGAFEDKAKECGGRGGGRWKIRQSKGVIISTLRMI